jgi:capsular polysaccharide biosynthesis protein
MVDSSGHGAQARLETLKVRLRRCVAMLSASRRRHEVVDVVGDAVSDEEAADAVRELLDVDPESASEIIEMPVKAFSKERASHLEDEAGRLQEKVSTLESGADAQS